MQQDELNKASATEIQGEGRPGDRRRQQAKIKEHGHNSDKSCSYLLLQKFYFFVCSFLPFGQLKF